MKNMDPQQFLTIYWANKHYIMWNHVFWAYLGPPNHLRVHFYQYFCQFCHLLGYFLPPPSVPHSLYISKPLYTSWSWSWSLGGGWGGGGEFSGTWWQFFGTHFMVPKPVLKPIWFKKINLFWKKRSRFGQKQAPRCPAGNPCQNWHIWGGWGCWNSPQVILE